MTKRRDSIAVIIILLMCVTTIMGILSLDFSHAYDFENQYGQTISIYGYGIYAFDSYFKAPIFIGTDMCMLFVLVPMFLYTYGKYRNGEDSVSELKLISVYAVVLYYAVSLAFGVTYNRLFLVYVALFSLSLFGMFWHVKKVKWNQTITVTRGLKLYLILSGAALIVAWFPDIIPSIITGDTLSLIEIYTTENTYVLDMGIISPLCFVCLYLLQKREPLGTMILVILLKACIIVGIMMIPQTLCQRASGIEIALPALLTKSASFLILGGFALYFNRRIYRELEEVKK